MRSVASCGMFPVEINGRIRVGGGTDCDMGGGGKSKREGSVLYIVYILY